jgi:hypothetical protein
MADWLGNNSRARKAAGEAVVGAKIDIEKDERFWSESVDGKLTAAMEGAWKARGKDLLTTKEGKDRVRKALADFEGTFAAISDSTPWTFPKAASSAICSTK